MQKESRREILAFFVIAFAAFLFVCIFTHSPRDTIGPSGRTMNGCGPLGAWLGHATISWLGKAASYALVAMVAAAGAFFLFGKRVTEVGWKLLGCALILLVVAASEVAWREDALGAVTLPGGFYGQFFYETLLSHLSRFGTFLLLGFVALVAAILSMDRALYPAVARAAGAAMRPQLWEGAASLARKAMGPIKIRPVEIPVPRFRWDTRGAVEKTRARADESRDRDERKRKTVAPKSAPAGDGTALEAEADPRPAASEPDGAATRRERQERKASAEGAAAGATEAPGEARGKGASKGAAKEKAPAPLPGPQEPDIDAREEEEEERIDARPPLKIRVSEAKSPTPARKRLPERPVDLGPYQLPPLDLLAAPNTAENPLDRSILEQTAAKIEETLRHFKIEAHVVEVQKGPTITQYEVSLAAGIKVHKIMNLADDLAMALKAPSIRIVAPIPGKSTVGVEVPNRLRNPVGLREILESAEFRDEDFKLPLALGRDVAGAPVIGDLGEMPHLLIAGSTGSGKSVCINSIIINLLMTRAPNEVKLILVDPKMVELAQFENIPHLLSPVVTDMKRAPAVLNWMVDKMEERYELLALTGVRHIGAYNALGKERIRERLQGRVDDADIADFPDFLPSIIVIIDELADLMMTSAKEVEASITRLSQKSRAVGIHVILATQRPSVDVITGLIKANMPSRVSFHVASKVDSRTILDRNGSEKLLGKGDMLYLPPGTSALQRVQGTFISDKEIRDVVQFAVRQAEPQFSPELSQFSLDKAGEGSEEDELYEEAVRIVLGSQRGSVTLFQRQLQIGYTRASRLMEIMHEHGLVGPFKGSKAREVYYTLEEWEEANAGQKASAKSSATGGGDGEAEDGEPGDEDVSAEDVSAEDGDDRGDEGSPRQHGEPGLP